MSMLAERKQKMKWNPNPCGNLWAHDNNKFGQKILEKFGWTPGKGLGAKEQGITDPVKLKCNSTQKGLGYERGNKVDFFQHQEEFNSILSNLNSEASQSDSDSKKVSLEEKSKNCKTRVHYHKFTRGKDLSRYSEKDLSCILGAFSSFQQNTSTDGNKIDEETTSTEQSTMIVNNKHEQTDSVVVTKKSRKRKHKEFPNDMTSELLTNVDTSDNIEFEETDTIEHHQVKLEKKRKKKKKETKDEPVCEEKSVCDIQLSNNIKKSKKKKKKYKE